MNKVLLTLAIAATLLSFFIFSQYFSITGLQALYSGDDLSAGNESRSERRATNFFPVGEVMVEEGEVTEIDEEIKP